MSSKPKNIIKKKVKKDDLDIDKLIEIKKKKCGISELPYMQYDFKAISPEYLPPQSTHPPEPDEYIAIGKSVLTELKEKIIKLEEDNKRIKEYMNNLTRIACNSDKNLEARIDKIEFFLYKK